MVLETVSQNKARFALALLAIVLITSNVVCAAPQFNILNITTQVGNSTHTNLFGLLTGNGTYVNSVSESNYTYLPGRVGGQTLNGGTNSGDDLVLNGSANNGDVLINPYGGGNVIINSTSGSFPLTVGGPIGTVGMIIDTRGNSGIFNLSGLQTGRRLEIFTGTFGTTMRTRGTAFPMVFAFGFNYNSSTATDFLFLTDSGKLGLGTSTPNANFETAGNISLKQITALSDSVNKSYAGTHGAAASITNGATITHGLGTTPTGCQIQSTVANTTMSVTALSSTTLTVSSWRTNTTAPLAAGATGISQTVYWECWV